MPTREQMIMVVARESARAVDLERLKAYVAGGRPWESDKHLLEAVFIHGVPPSPCPPTMELWVALGKFFVGTHVELVTVHQWQAKFDRLVEDLGLSARSINCLRGANIKTVADLVQRTDADLLKVKDFGRTSLKEIKARLAEMGLSLGMKLENWPPTQAP